jgi:hypothetical protein
MTIVKFESLMISKVILQIGYLEFANHDKRNSF